MPVSVPCGQCIGCRLEKSRQWAIRCLHESKMHENNCFITLTYDEEHLPEDGSLNLPDFQKFMKRYRKAIGIPIRFFHCGEYGDKTKRPHYHALIFGHDFCDKELWSRRNGEDLYVSPTLERLWPFGFSTIGQVTFESAAYVARYVMKKVTGPLAIHEYCEVDWTTGEILSERKPEYTTMSRRPGIGSSWFQKWSKDVYPSDEIIINGKQVKPPKFYDSQFEIMNSDQYQLVRKKRKADALRHKDNNTPERRRVREKVQRARLNLLPRNLE